MKVLSLFDGIAGARQALKKLNIDCEYYASEVDKYAIQVAEANHPDIMHIGDVKSLFKYEHITDSKYRQFYNIKRGSFDLLIGGSPCQDLSIAKKDRKGLEGNRSSLFYEYLRILNETKPKYFILENVFSMSKESKAIITQELFGIEPIMINSALLTAQNRKRLYWVGKLIDGKYQQVKIEQPEDKGVYLKDIIEDGIVDRGKSYCIDANYSKGGNLKSYFEKGRRQLVFNKPIKIGHFNKGGQGDRVYSQEGKSVCLSANGGGKGAKTGLYAIAQRGRNIVDGYTIRKLTTTECCRLQGFPDNYVSMVSNTQGYKALGNSFTVPVIKKILLDFL
jgi:DNA (cytosine-5)-methyltransferase 3A